MFEIKIESGGESLLDVVDNLNDIATQVKDGVKAGLGWQVKEIDE